MKIGISKLLFLTLFGHFGCALVAQVPLIALSVQGGVRFEPSQSELAVGPRISLHHSFSDDIAIGAVYSAGHFTREFDSPSGMSSTSVSMRTYRLVAGWSPVDVKILRMRFEVGAGLSSYSIPAKTISLGALGERTVPSQSDQAITYSLGVILQKEIVPHVGLQLSPEVLISPTSSMGNPVYCIGGGINIEIL